MNAQPQYPIILQSRDGQFFRRIHEDGRFEKKSLGLEWEPHDPPTITAGDLQRYLFTMTERLKWKMSRPSAT